jgi:hypothetical protein
MKRRSEGRQESRGSKPSCDSHSMLSAMEEKERQVRAKATREPHDLEGPGPMVSSWLTSLQISVTSSGILRQVCMVSTQIPEEAKRCRKMEESLRRY